MLEERETEDDFVYDTGVGDAEGQQEYPFITSPKVLGIMKTLHELNRKQLHQDLLNSAQEHDSCPKGSSYSAKDCKASIPGPFWSCPMLHESGDDFCNLPFAKRQSVNVKLGLNSKKGKKKNCCRKCSGIPFNIIDSSDFHDNYVKHCTRNKLKFAGDNPIFSCCSTSKGLSNNTANAVNDSLETSDSDIQSHTVLTEIMDLINPTRPRTPGDKKGGKKKRTKVVTNKPVITSRYREVASRRAKVTKPGNEAQGNDKDSESDVQKNPFPMPDAFEEIYFGQMPESFSTLPVSLQNFKKSQMKLADSGSATQILEPLRKTSTTSGNQECANKTQEAPREHHIIPLNLKKVQNKPRAVAGKIRHKTDDESSLIHLTNKIAQVLKPSPSSESKHATLEKLAEWRRSTSLIRDSLHYKVNAVSLPPVPSVGKKSHRHSSRSGRQLSIRKNFSMSGIGQHSLTGPMKKASKKKARHTQLRQPLEDKLDPVNRASRSYHFHGVDANFNMGNDLIDMGSLQQQSVKTNQAQGGVTVTVYKNAILSSFAEPSLKALDKIDKSIGKLRSNDTFSNKMDSPHKHKSRGASKSKAVSLGGRRRKKREKVVGK